MKRREQMQFQDSRGRCVLGEEGRQGLDKGSSLLCSPLWDHVQLNVVRYSCLPQGGNLHTTIPKASGP